MAYNHFKSYTFSISLRKVRGIKTVAQMLLIVFLSMDNLKVMPPAALSK